MMVRIIYRKIDAALEEVRDYVEEGQRLRP
jgi:hypothetical protein